MSSKQEREDIVSIIVTLLIATFLTICYLLSPKTPRVYRKKGLTSSEEKQLIQPEKENELLKSLHQSCEVRS